MTKEMLELKMQVEMITISGLIFVDFAIFAKISTRETIKFMFIREN